MRLKRPNILLLYVDQLRLDALSCYGSEIIETPNIDRLAKDGVQFNNYYVNNPVCSPSRMCLLSGRYCSSLGVGGNGVAFPPDAMGFQHIIKPYGYDTAQIGKLHFDPHAKRDHKNPTKTYGFDTFILSDEPGCYDDAYTKWVEGLSPESLEATRTSLPPAAKLWGKKEYSQRGRETHEPYIFDEDPWLTHTGFVTSEICNFLDTHNPLKPFFTIAGYYAPHPPINPPAKYLERVHWDKIKMPIKGEKEEWLPFLQGISEEEWVKVIGYYHALVLHVDEYIGYILDALERNALEQDTIVIFTSDHGEYLGDHGRIQKGMPGYDCITHMPFIMRYPSTLPRGESLKGFVESVDIVPTLLDFAFVQTPSYVQGKSVYQALMGNMQTDKSSILVEFFDDHGNTQIMVRNNQYMYYMNNKGEELLYDCKFDPNQLMNIADDPKLQCVISLMRKEMLVKVMHSAYESNEKIDAY